MLNMLIRASDAICDADLDNNVEWSVYTSSSRRLGDSDIMSFFLRSIV